MRRNLTLRRLAIALAAASQSALLAAAPIGNIEGPAEGAIVSGVVNIWGWAVDAAPIRSVEFAVDDEPFRTRLGYGGSRGDVGRAHPELYQADYSGFAGAYHTKHLSNGEHLFRVRVTSEQDEVTILENRFIVSNTPERDVTWDQVDLTGAIPRITEETLFLDGLRINGVRYDNVDLTFDPYSNAFRITFFKDDLDQDGYHDTDSNRDGLVDAAEAAAAGYTTGDTVTPNTTTSTNPSDGSGDSVTQPGSTTFQLPAPTAGRLLASQCAQCHGPDGVSHTGLDGLSGESGNEIAEELGEFRFEGSGIMHFQSLGYTDQEIQLIADWFSSQRSAGSVAEGDGDDD